MDFNLPININGNIDANIAEIIQSNAKTYGYNKPFYIGKDSIRVIYMDKDSEVCISKFDCKCQKCPYAIKSNDNIIIQYEKNTFLKKCNCKKQMENLYDEYLSKTNIWNNRSINEINCQICLKVFQNKNGYIPDYIPLPSDFRFNKGMKCNFRNGLY